jgi:hypothetical protein
MARPPKGQVVVNRAKRGTTYAAKFRAYGERRYETLDASTPAEAEEALANILADVRRGIWRRATPDSVEHHDTPELTFHQFSSEWLAAKKPELTDRTYEDYKWSLTHHLLPYLRAHRLSEITVREVDRYKSTKLADRVLSANSLNETLTRLAQILAVAVEYELIPANPAAGKRRRVKGTKPRRPWVEPEQLMTLLQAAEAHTEAERNEYDRAVEWASWATEAPLLGSTAQSTLVVPESDEVFSYTQSPA